MQDFGWLFRRHKIIGLSSNDPAAMNAIFLTCHCSLEGLTRLVHNNALLVLAVLGRAKRDRNVTKPRRIPGSWGPILSPQRVRLIEFVREWRLPA